MNVAGALQHLHGVSQALDGDVRPRDVPRDARQNVVWIAEHRLQGLTLRADLLQAQAQTPDLHSNATTLLSMRRSQLGSLHPRRGLTYV